MAAQLDLFGRPAPRGPVGPAAPSAELDRARPMEADTFTALAPASIALLARALLAG